MKQAIGSLLCIVAILRIVSLIALAEPHTTAHRFQDWALVGVLLAIGITLSTARKQRAG